MIVERLIKIHRYPIYLHYRLLQMWSFKLSVVFFLIFARKLFRFFIFTLDSLSQARRGGWKQFSPGNFKIKIILISIHAHQSVRLKPNQQQIAVGNLLAMI